MTVIPDDILKLRLAVVLTAHQPGEALERALTAWHAVEPASDDEMGRLLIDAVVQALGEIELVMLIGAAASLHGFSAGLTETLYGLR